MLCSLHFHSSSMFLSFSYLDFWNFSEKFISYCNFLFLLRTFVLTTEMADYARQLTAGNRFLADWITVTILDFLFTMGFNCEIIYAHDLKLFIFTGCQRQSQRSRAAWERNMLIFESMGNFLFYCIILCICLPSGKSKSWEFWKLFGWIMCLLVFCRVHATRWSH